jgi:hypothetical protein
MKLTKYILFFFLAIASLSCFGQEKSIKGYRIEGDEVVFTFDRRDYETITDERNQLRMDFGDFDIENVVVSGQFNLWSRDAWKMKKVGEYTYELRKKTADFKDNLEWEFKFVINHNYWAEPSEDIQNITPAVDGSKYLNAYNLKFFKAYVSDKGNATFSLPGFQDAKKVILAGSFNKWDEELFVMNKTESGWKLTLQLPPDVYEYKFIVDGEWMTDPTNPEKVRNEFHGYNSFIAISKEVTFTLFGFQNAKRVILAGDFNDWSESELEMTKTDKGWTYTILLIGGKYHYKFIVDGEWMVDPNNKIREYDGRGNINSVKMVR